MPISVGSSAAGSCDALLVKGDQQGSGATAAPLEAEDAAPASGRNLALDRETPNSLGGETAGAAPPLIDNR